VAAAATAANAALGMRLLMVEYPPVVLDGRQDGAARPRRRRS
jgi:hypothetical protein